VARQQTGTFKLGRVVFYPFAGVTPALAVFMLLISLSHPLKETFEAQVSRDVDAVDLVLLWFTALVSGFLVVAGAFVTVIKDLSAHTDVTDFLPGNFSFPLRYPVIKGDQSESYDSWLISEYYRYVEVAVYIPLGVLLSLPIFSIYCAVYLLRQAGTYPTAGFSAGHSVFLSACVITVSAWLFVWPYYRTAVLVPLYLCYEQAKKALMIGVKLRRRDEWHELGG
jgi:hypothetical protein